jgi:hypothetical protein
MTRLWLGLKCGSGDGYNLSASSDLYGSPTPLSPAPSGAFVAIICNMDKMAVLLDRLTKVQNHVEQGALHIAEQKQRLADLRRDGHDTTEARALLDTLKLRSRTRTD